MAHLNLNNRMRHIASTIPIIFLFCCFALFSGCDEFLDIEPHAVLNSDGYLTGEVQAEQFLTGAYDMLNKRYTSDKILFLAGDIKSDDAWNREDFGFKDYTHLPDNGQVQLAWENYYEAIKRCNRVVNDIAKMDQGQIDPDLRNRFVAEGKFLRAYFYFKMHQLWYNVPMITEVLPANQKSSQVGQSSIETFWSQLETDLSDAIKGLPLKSEYENDDIGRVTKGAAYALKSMVHLYQEEWQEAYQHANAVIQSNEYVLEDVFLEVFNLDHNSEVIFERQNMDGGLNFEGAYGDTWPDASEGTEYPVWARSIPFGGWQLRGVTRDLYDAFEPGDPRLHYTIAVPGDTIQGHVVGDDGYRTEGLYGPRKLYAEYTWERESLSHSRNSGSNWPIIRLGEIYLIRAESNIKLNKLDAAAADINQVRNRPDVSMPDVGPFTDQQDAMDAIIHERRIELAMESVRFFDLVRWGIADDELSELGFDKDQDEYLPIPQKEIDLSGGKLQQNKGY